MPSPDVFAPDADPSDPDADAGTPDGGGESGPLLELDLIEADLSYIIGTTPLPSARVNVRSRGVLNVAIEYRSRSGWLEARAQPRTDGVTPYQLALTDANIIEGVYVATAIFTATDGAESASATVQLTLMATPSETEPLPPRFAPDKVMMGADEIVYLYARALNQVFRRSLVASRWLTPIALSNQSSYVAYSTETHHLYIAYASGSIRQIDLDAGVTEETFASVPLGPHGLETAGSVVLAADPSGAWGTHYTFLPNGARAAAVEWNYNSPEYAWSPALGRMFFLRDHSPSDLHFETIDPITGAITSSGESPYHGDFITIQPIRPSPDGSYVLLGSGDLYDGTSLDVVGSIPVEPRDAAWLADGTLLTIRSHGGGTRLEQWVKLNQLFVMVNFQDYAGAPMSISPQENAALIITQNNNTLVFSTYSPTEDGDGDGVPFAEDAFPLDPAASVDTDGDDYPDAWNPGKTQADSTTGLTLDAFPNDSACHLASQGMPNDPTVCDVANGIPAYIPNRVVLGDDEIYLFSRQHRRIFRWSLATNYHLNPFVLSGTDPLDIAYSSENQRLYISDASGAITSIDRTTGIERPFASLPSTPLGLSTAGPIVFAVDGSGAWATHYTFLPNGTQVEARDWNEISSEYVYNEALGRMFFFRDNTFPNDLHWESINTTTGVITSVGDSPYHGDFDIRPPIRPSVDGSHVLLGSGDLYDGNTLEVVSSLPTEPLDAAWMADGTLITIRDGGNSNTLIEQWAENGQLFELVNLQTIAGQPVRILVHGQNVMVISSLGFALSFNSYLPTDDGDGDGVPFGDDAFPLDIAASVDTDGDGYPDSWNAGYGQTDSTTGLMLDAFPNDSACQLASHALPNDPTLCDVANGVPNYLPDQVMIGADDVVYLYSQANSRVYRWSLATDYHLNPIVLGNNDSSHVAYSESPRRLYATYDSGAITQIDLATLSESPFATIASAPEGLAVAGSTVFVASGTHYTFTSQGVPVANQSGYYSSREYVWNAALQRMFFLRDNTSPNDLHYVQINPATSQILSSGESPYHGAYTITTPIRPSQDGAHVLLGSGDLYDGTSLEVVGSIPVEPADAAWLADGTLLTIRTFAGATLLEQWARTGAVFSVVNFASFPGTPIRVLPSTAGAVVITSQGARPVFADYVPTDDGDGDGVAFSSDAFPLDPAASLDTDHDGYPDSWNAGYGPADSTTGLILDAFPADSACQLPQHALASNPALCDIANGVPPYVPDRVELGADGIVYLFSVIQQKIFRWSLVADYHLNPILLSGTDATHMAFSAANARIYVAYESGSITQIDLATMNETPFASLPLAPQGLAVAGTIVMSADYSGAWATHYTFSADGTQVSAAEWNYISSEYAWCPALGRMFFFRDSQSPNDLHWESINTTTGMITGEGESPYHGQYPIYGVIRPSPDGSYVLLGAGNIYDGTSLTMLQSMSPVDDAAWRSDGSLVTLRRFNPGSTIVELWSPAFALLSSQTLTGLPIRIFTTGTETVLITRSATGPVFQTVAL